jgi:hypothetical protein
MVQNISASDGPIARHARHFPPSIDVDASGDGDRHADNAAGLTLFQISGIEPKTGASRGRVGKLLIL